ncbi:MAG: winged helix-turn-helix transcriptional regulator [bacterium]
MKTAKQLERHFKGAANYRRIEILLLISKHKNISLEDIAEILKWNIKTISEHTVRLTQSGLLDKVYFGRRVGHSLSPYGKKFISFMKSLGGER